MKPPVLTILAGSNGCGKTTLTSYAREEFQLNPILDPDAVAKSERSNAEDAGSNIEAGKSTLGKAEELLQKKQGFTVRRHFRETRTSEWRLALRLLVSR